MNTYVTNLWNDLMTLVNESDAFFYADHQLDQTTYRIFNYRLATYSDFCKPGALECRGSMFEIDDDGNCVQLVALPQQKFFNLGECPFTMNLDLSHDNIRSIMIKEDGSLISTFIHTDGEMYCKSKGSIRSEQAQWANAWLRRDSDRYNQYKTLTAMGFTISLEYCAPHNRIVVNYPGEDLTVLNVRNMENGAFVDKRVFIVDGYSMFPEVTERWVAQATEWDRFAHYRDNLEQLIEDQAKFEGLEGFVVELKDGTFFKLKNDWYLTQHRAKDNIDTPRRLFEAAIMDITDDLRSLFFDNEQVLTKIEEMENLAANVYNGVVRKVENFVKDHTHLIENDQRKEFAIAGQQHFQDEDKRLFSLAMQSYKHKQGQGDGPDFKEFCIKNWRDWGIADDKPEID